VEEYKFIDSKFRLVILAARRAKQLVRGSKKRVDINAENPLTVALKEIENGLVNFEILNEKVDMQEVVEAVGESDDETADRDDIFAALEKDEEDEEDEEDEDPELNSEDEADDESVESEGEVS
jgi:DNA-directed RNA polymerase subunit omega